MLNLKKEKSDNPMRKIKLTPQANNSDSEQENQIESFRAKQFIYKVR